MGSNSRGRPPNAHSDRFRNALWAWRVHSCLKCSWADLDNLYLIEKGKRPEKYVRGDYDVINVMERVYREGRNPTAYKRKRKKNDSSRTARPKPVASVNLVGEFVGWVEEGQTRRAVESAQSEFLHPIWGFLAGKRVPASNDWMVAVHRVLARRGLLKFRGAALVMAREVAGKSFPAQEGDLEEIARGANLIAGEPSLDSLLVLAFEYRDALDRLQPAEAQCYLDAFLIAARSFAAHIGDAYLANGICLLIALRLFRNDWRVIGPEKWRRGEQRKDLTGPPTYGMVKNDRLLDLFDRGPRDLGPLTDIVAPGTPIVEPDDKMGWFATNLEACFTTLYLERTGGPGPSGTARPSEGGGDLLAKAKSLWGEYEPADQGVSCGWSGRRKASSKKQSARGRQGRRTRS